jgi:hypothetical protein
MKIISKHLVLLTFVACTLKATAQGIVSLPEMKVLYKEYDNNLKIGFDQEIENYRIEIEGAKWSESEKWNFIVRPYLNSNYVRIVIYNGSDEKLKEHYYSCIELPKPRLYWGSEANGSWAAAEETNLFIRYDFNSYYLSETFRPIEWQVSIGKVSVKGKGNKLSKEVRDLIYSQKQDEVIVSITSKYISSSNGKGAVSAKFKVFNPFFVGEISKGRVFVIDKDSNNLSLFDKNDPFSLISQIHSSFIDQPVGMSSLTAECLTGQGHESIEYFFRYLPTFPVANSIGDDSTTILSNGKLEYVYHPDQKKIFFDKSDITRMVFYENTFTDPSSQQKVTTISHVGLAKKYPNNNKFDVVMLIPFTELSTCWGLIAIYKESNNSSLQKLLSEINRTQTKESMESALKTGSNFTNFNLSKYFDVPMEVVRDHFSMDIFDSSFYYVEQSELPLTNSFGDDSLIHLSDGTYNLVYPEPDTIVFKVYVNPQVMTTFVQYELRMDAMNKPQLQVSNVVYAIKRSEINYAFGRINLDNLPNELLNVIDLSILNSINIDELPWKYKLREEIEKSKSYLLTSKRDIKLLGKEFNLDIMGRPANF